MIEGTPVLTRKLDSVPDQGPRYVLSSYYHRSWSVLIGLVKEDTGPGPNYEGSMVHKGFIDVHLPKPIEVRKEKTILLIQ